MERGECVHMLLSRTEVCSSSLPLSIHSDNACSGWEDTLCNDSSRLSVKTLRSFVFRDEHLKLHRKSNPVKYITLGYISLASHELHK